MLIYVIPVSLLILIASAGPALPGLISPPGGACLLHAEHALPVIAAASKSSSAIRKRAVIRRPAARRTIRARSSIRRPGAAGRSRIRKPASIRRKAIRKPRVKALMKTKVRAKVRVPAATSGNAKPGGNAVITRLPQRGGFRPAPEQPGGLGDKNRMPREDIGGPAGFGEKIDPAVANLPKRPGDSRVAPGTALGGAAGPGGAGEDGKPASAERDPNSVTPGGGGGDRDDTPSQNTGGGGLGHESGHTEGGASPAGGEWGARSSAVAGDPRANDDVIHNLTPPPGVGGGANINRGSGSGQKAGKGAVDGVLNLDATGRPRPGGAGSGRFRPLPNTQPGVGQGQDIMPEPGDFRKNVEKKDNPFGRVIIRPGQGPRSPDPVTQPPAGMDGGSTMIRSTRNKPTLLEKRMQHTDPAGGTGGAAAR